MAFESIKIPMTVKEEIDPESSDDSKDLCRTEEPWNNNHETYFNTIIDECELEKKQYDVLATRNRIYYKLFSIPVVVLPISLSVLNKYFTTDTEYIRMILLLFSGTLSGVNVFLNFGSKVTKYSDYSGKYTELKTIIKAQLIKKKRFRIDCDVFSERINQIYLELNKNAPL